MTSLLDFFRERCPLWRRCKDYQRDGDTCNSVDPSYCGKYRRGKDEAE